VPPELTYFGDVSGAGGSRIGDGGQEVDAGSKKRMVQKDEARQQASRTMSFHHVTTSGLWCTPKMVHITSRGIHPQWYTPPALVYTQNGLPHEAWFTPSAYSPEVLLANYNSADSLTIQKILLYIEANAKYRRFGR